MRRKQTNVIIFFKLQKIFRTRSEKYIDTSHNASIKRIHESFYLRKGKEKKEEKGRV